MQIQLGEKIRALRHRDGRTQEALANAIGVTSQAVSRWESNGGYPDMETIPAIANYFHITIDELFGYSGDRETAIQSILREADEQIQKAVSLESYIDRLRAYSGEYPSDARIQLRLAIVLTMLGFQRHGARSSIPNSGRDGENIVSYNRENKDFSEALTVYERILPDLSNPEDRETAIKHMVRLYSIRGEYQKAQSLAIHQNSISISREILLPVTSVGDQRTIHQGELLLSLAWNMANTVISQVTLRNDLRSNPIGINKALAMISLYKTILDDENYGFGSYAIMELYRLCARTAAELEMTNEAKMYAQKWYEYHYAYTQLKQAGGKFRYTAPLVRNVTANVNEMPPVIPWNETLSRQPEKFRRLLHGDPFFDSGVPSNI